MLASRRQQENLNHFFYAACPWRKSRKARFSSRHTREYIRGCGVKKIGLFGSFSKGTQHKKSDLDFLVVFDSPTFDNYMDLKFLLEKIFKKNVDLVTEDNLKPAFKHVKGE